MRLTCRRPGGKHSVKFSRLPETGMSRSSSPSSRPVSLHRVTVSAAYPLFMLGIGHERGLEDEVLLAGSARWVLLKELRAAPEPTLSEYVARFAPCDLVLVEGFKKEAIPKLEVHRPVTGQPPLWPGDAQIVAVASDSPPPGNLRAGVAWLDVNDAPTIARYILARAMPLAMAID